MLLAPLVPWLPFVFPASPLSLPPVHAEANQEDEDSDDQDEDDLGDDEVIEEEVGPPIESVDDFDNDDFDDDFDDDFEEDFDDDDDLSISAGGDSQDEDDFGR